MTIKIGGVTGGRIKEYTSDPTKPITINTNVLSKNLWILKTTGTAPSTKGSPMGLLLTLTYADTVVGGANTYQLSVNTTGGIQRVLIP